MEKPDTIPTEVEVIPSPQIERGEKGSATLMIADEVRATQEKTARLRALRLARDEAEATERAAAPAPAKPKKKVTQRKAKSTS